MGHTYPFLAENWSEYSVLAQSYDRLIPHLSEINEPTQAEKLQKHRIFQVGRDS